MRKAAFQQYAIATRHNVCKLPRNVSIAQGASLGVAYVAATVALGVCMGLDYSRSKGAKGPDLFNMIRALPPGSLPQDVAAECLDGITEDERPQPGDWIAIWGGSSTSALFISQLARLAGLRVILVVDLAKHGAKIIARENSVLVDSSNAQRAVEVIRALTGNSLRFGIDTVGKETSGHLLDSLADVDAEKGRRAHIIGLSGMQKSTKRGIVIHSVPIKVFHEVPVIGRALMDWLESLLEKDLILPEIALAEGGLEGINGALDRMRRGEISGRRLVVPL